MLVRKKWWAVQKIKIYDVTLRDGEQTPGVNLNLSEKLEIAKQLERLYVDTIEAGFPQPQKEILSLFNKLLKPLKIVR